MYEVFVGLLAGVAGAALWWFVSFATMGVASSEALFMLLSYLWLVVIFAALVWLFHNAERRIARNVIAVIGCIVLMLDSACWVGLNAGWFRVGG